jgi:hypothetical protein
MVSFMSRDLLFAATRISLQVAAGVGGWFLVVEIPDLGMAIAVFLVFVVFAALEMARARRYERLYLKMRLWMKQRPYKLYYWTIIAILIIVGLIGIILVVFMHINISRLLYVVLALGALAPEVWLALNRYRAK